MRKMHTFTIAVFAVAALGATGCMADGSDVYASSSAPLVDSACPDGWADAALVRILCAEGYHLEYRTYAGTRCVRCAPDAATTVCRGPWIVEAADVACGPGYEMRYNHDGSCKRCARANANVECRTDADCFRTGCSGQICAGDHVASTCEFRPEYACYSDELCGCTDNGCGWANDPALQACLADTEGSTTLLLQ